MELRLHRTKIFLLIVRTVDVVAAAATHEAEREAEGEDSSLSTDSGGDYHATEATLRHRLWLQESFVVVVRRERGIWWNSLLYCLSLVGIYIGVQ